MLMRAGRRRQHEVLVCGVADLELDDAAQVCAKSRRLGDEQDLQAMLTALCRAPVERHCIDKGDVLLLRVNPARDRARDWAYQTALLLARFARDRGCVVLNDPEGLVQASSKLYLSLFPSSVRPRTLVTHDPQALRAFVEQAGSAVLKPLRGTRGSDVFLVEAAHALNLNQIIDVLRRSDFVIAQEYLTDAPQGDVRLVLLEGKVLEIDGTALAIRRRPGAGEFRSNIHAGGRAEAAELTPELRALAELVGPRLRADGIFLAGLDVVGDRLVEINVFATGGFRDAELFTGHDYSARVIEAIEACV